MKANLVIGTPCYGGQVTSLYTQSVLQFQKACFSRDEVQLNSVAQWGDSLLTRARQGIVTQFLWDESATHLLFVDGDRGFEPEQVFRLLHFDADFTASPREKGSFETAGLAPLVRNGFVKVSAVGADLMLLKKSALKSMIGRYPELRYKSEFGTGPDDPRQWSYALFNCRIDKTSGKFLSEDHSFCRRWTDMGGEIWVDQGVEG